MTTPAGLTQVAHKRNIMIEVAKHAVEQTLDPVLVMRFPNHCQKHWPTVMDLGDLPLGN